MAITPKDIDHLAILARLGVSDAEKKKLVADLERILAYVGELNNVNTENVEPMAGGTDLENAMRDDEERIDTYEAKDYLLEQVPTKEGRWAKAPRILE